MPSLQTSSARSAPPAASREGKGHQDEAQRARLVLAIAARLGRATAERIPDDALAAVAAAVIPGGSC
jgi:hypothetical protein